MTKSQIAIIGAAGMVVILVILAFIFGRKAPPPVPVTKTPVSFWGLKSDEPAWKAVIAQYEASHPTITINLTSIDPNSYESALLDALAAGTGPDILMFHYDWMAKHKNKVLPAPDQVIVSGAMPELFPKAAAEDFVADGKVYALPVSMNTMALVYNRDYFDSKGVPQPPATWDDIKAMIPKLRELQNGKIVRSAISIGGSERNGGNIQNADDLMTLVLLQNGASFFKNRETGLGGIAATGGANSLRFYLDFSDPQSKNFAFYAGTAANSLDAFANGDSAMVFVYPQDLQYIKSKNQVQNYKVVPMPQLNANKPVNLTDYWGLAVSNHTSNYGLAWDFISFATLNQSAVGIYTSASGNQPALRSAIAGLSQDPILSVFAPQVLNAVSLPKKDKAGFRAVIDNMIESSVRDRATIDANVAAADSSIQRYQ